ncbi:PREDICTED: uncharacterized protein LOC105363554 [Ceratosolen solmsi marchali]|uniref:Uncharacterized protein LOC105363554 n=1 Tax=Ceratosolen solmsi marchali TaxID=326594 RepID=A0AAJ6YK85_9HYME|nr:PREDICTED: uncharacterized protein LOC105363554 [Ceratosolen solmsi marchali]
MFMPLRCVTGLGHLNNLAKREEPKCFRFSWLGPTFDNNTNINCSSTAYKEIPCIEPFEISVKPPNITHMWINENRSEFYCLLRAGYSCIKYTYNFNGAVVNSTHFCGKVIEGTAHAIPTGCFTQKVGGHIIEACACRSNGFGMPCNLSIRHTYSTAIITLLLLSVNAASYLRPY